MTATGDDGLTAAGTWRRWWPRGAWYFLVTVLSLGFLAAIPFWHAAMRLRRPRVRGLAALYTLADIGLVVLLAVTPTRPDGTSSSSPLSTIAGLLVIAIVIAGCIQLSPLRREVYDTSETVLAEHDPAVARALAARAKREEARRILAKDPALARDLGIGRPDLGKGFDDGGLVDLNSADAATIARVCEIPPTDAQAIVAARGTRGGAYFNVGEALVDVDLPPEVQERLQERAVVYESQF